MVIAYKRAKLLGLDRRRRGHRAPTFEVPDAMAGRELATSLEWISLKNN